MIAHESARLLHAFRLLPAADEGSFREHVRTCAECEQWVSENGPFADLARTVLCAMSAEMVDATIVRIELDVVRPTAHVLAAASPNMSLAESEDGRLRVGAQIRQPSGENGALAYLRIAWKGEGSARGRRVRILLSSQEDEVLEQRWVALGDDGSAFVTLSVPLLSRPPTLRVGPVVTAGEKVEDV